MVENSSPIQNIDTIDIVGVRKDGGVDTVIVCSGPLDDSPDLLLTLGSKVHHYLRDIASEDFRETYGAGPARILLWCEHSVSDAVLDMIKAFQEEAAVQDVHLQLVATVA
jgi:hypothetical protein